MTTITPDMLITTYLEMTSSTEFRPSYRQASDVEIRHMDSIDTDFYRFLYSTVGKEIRWRDRLLVSEAELHAAISSPAVDIYVLYVNEVPAGYVELEVQGDSTEIAYFGLFPEFYGRGLGSHLLSFGIEQAWNNGAKRVYVHTCNLDHPAAMQNYLKRGFRVYHVIEQPMPDRYRQ